MKVGELILALSKVDPNREVVMSKDGEGNDYSPLSQIDETEYKALCTWSGYIGFKEMTPELIKDGYDEQDLVKDGVPAIVLWPTN